MEQTAVGSAARCGPATSAESPSAEERSQSAGPVGRSQARSGASNGMAGPCDALRTPGSDVTGIELDLGSTALATAIAVDPPAAASDSARSRTGQQPPAAVAGAAGAPQGMGLHQMELSSRGPAPAVVPVQPAAAPDSVRRHTEPQTATATEVPDGSLDETGDREEDLGSTALAPAVVAGPPAAHPDSANGCTEEVPTTAAEAVAVEASNGGAPAAQSVPADHKLCSACHAVKLLGDFRKRASNADGVEPECKTCRSVKQKDAASCG